MLACTVIFAGSLYAQGHGGQTPGAVKPPQGQKPQPPTQPQPDPNKILVTEYEPMFLQSSGKQAIRIEGSFPIPDEIEVLPQPPLSPDAEYSIKDSEILLNVTVSDNTSNVAAVLIRRRTAPGGGSQPQPRGNEGWTLTFEVQDACSKHVSVPQSQPSVPPGWANLCRIPDSIPNCKDSLKKKSGTCVYGMNALTHQRTTNLSNNTAPQFCGTQWTGFGEFDRPSTYLTVKDSAAVLVCNQNPFRWATTLSRNDTAIKNDDPSILLGALDPALGLKNASDAATQATKNSGSQSQTGTQTKNNTGGQAKAQAQVEAQAKNLLAAKPKPLPKGLTFNFQIVSGVSREEPNALTFKFADPVQQCVQDISKVVDADDTAISNFIEGYNPQKAVMEDDSTPCDTRLTDATNLWTSAQMLPTKDLNGVQQDISALQQEIAYRLSVVKPYASDPLGKSETAALTAQNQALVQQECVVADLLTTTTTISKSVAVPIQNILGTNGSLIYISTAVGEDHDPVERVWKLSSTLKTKDSVADTSDFGQNTYAACLNPQKGQQQQQQKQNPNHGNGQNPTQSPNPNGDQNPGGDDTVSLRHDNSGVHYRDAMLYTSAEHSVVVDEASAALQSGNQPTNSPGQPGGQSKKKTGDGNTGGNNNNGQQDGQQTTPQTSAAVTQEDGPTIDATFGAPRFVVSAGTAAVILRNRQYQKVQANGQSSGTTIEYSTNSLTRISPLLMGHIRLWQYHGTDDGLFGTLGVSGASNNQGASAEYFLGLTSSFAHNWVFVSPGLYIGQSLSLSGDYKVGDPLPAKFSGSVPTEQSYKVGFGLAISIRIPGTTSPKTKTTDSNGTGNNGKSKTKTTGTSPKPSS
jgi:hypothetical protein